MTSVPKAGGFFEYKTQFLSSYPIINTSNIEIKEQIITKVNQILSLKQEHPKADTSILESEIDQMVYQLYGLTAEEISIVENS